MKKNEGSSVQKKLEKAIKSLPKDKYWIEILRIPRSNFYFWFWRIKCCNGRVKSVSKYYEKHSLCFNDAYAFAEWADMEIR